MKVVFFVAVVLLAVASAVPMPQPKRPASLPPKVKDLAKRLSEIKEPAPIPHQGFEHTPMKKPTEEDKQVAAENRLAKVLDAVKFLQGQQMVLGSALHSVHSKIQSENEQIDDQQKVLAKSMEALIENVATRQDMQEIELAAGEDNDVHVELQETTDKLRKALKHMLDHQGSPDSDLVESWERLKKTVEESSVDAELDYSAKIIDALRMHSENSSSSLYHFIMLNLILLVSIWLWWRSKAPSYSYSR